MSSNTNTQNPPVDNGGSSENSSIPQFNFKNKSTPKNNSNCFQPTSPLSVSEEFDERNKKAADSKYDRSYWEMELLRRHPELRDLINRVDPVTRAITLGSLFLPNYRLHPQDNILSLISQHLKILGLTKTAQSLTDSFSLPLETPEHHSCSQLLHHLERSVVSSDRFWCLLLPTPSYPTTEKLIQKQLVTQLNGTLGVFSAKTQEIPPLDEQDATELEKYEIDPENQQPKEITVNQLIWIAVTRPKNVGTAFVAPMAMTYQLYMPTTQFFKKLQECWTLIKKVDPEDKRTLELYFVAFVEKWIETSFFDFDAALISNLTQWISTLKMKQPSGAKRILQSIQKQIEGSSKNEVMEITERKIHIPENLFTGDFSLLSLDVHEFAYQLTMNSCDLYYKITPKELLNCAWSNALLKHRAPNIVALTDKFNRLSQWGQNEILCAKSIGERLKLMKYFATLATTLWDMKNYFDGVAVATIFESTAMYRLNHHKQLLGEEALKDVNHIINDEMSSDKNFARIRQIYKQAKDSLPAIPYVGPYLTDLIFTYDGMPDYINGLPNLTKCLKVFDLIDSVMAFQRKQFNFLKIDQIQDKIKNLHGFDEQDLYAKSLLIEYEKSYDEFLQRYNSESKS